MLLAAAPARAASLADVPVGEYIRLHVVAEDDGEAAQALKLEVRDACLIAARALLADCGSADEAWARIAGDYRAVRVVIGAGEGHNWWCVLYPSLCLPEGAEGEMRFHSVILNWLRGLLGGGR